MLDAVKWKRDGLMNGLRPREWIRGRRLRRREQPTWNRSIMSPFVKQR